MIGLKKYFGDELLQLTIILSLLRADPSRYINLRWSDASVGDYEVVLGPSLAYAQVDFMNVHNRYHSYRHCVHQKNIESVIIDQEALFNELNLLGRYGRRSSHPYAANAEITTYLLNGQGPTDASSENNGSSGDNDGNGAEGGDSDADNADGQLEGHHGHFDEARRRGTVVGHEHDYAALEPDVQGADSCKDDDDGGGDDAHGLTKEDMDLIEIWMRQDIDLGVTRDAYDPQYVKDKLEEDLANVDGKQKEDQDQIAENEPVEDAWSSLKYTIDSETGEHVAPCSSDEESALAVVPSKENENNFKEDPSIKEEVALEDLEEEDPLVDSGLSELLDRILREEQAVDTESFAGLKLPVKLEKEDDLVSERDLATDDELVDTLDHLNEMLQTAQLHHPHPHHGHPRSLQARMPYLRSMSMEQRWQDLANLLSLPNASTAMHPPHHHHHHHHPAMHANATGHHHHHHHHHHHPHPPPPPPPHHAPNYSVPGYPAVDNRTSVLLQNATLPAPVADINSNLSYQGEVGVGDPSNITAALVTSLTTLTNSTDTLSDSSHHGHYQMDSAGALMYPGNHSEVNQTTDGFLSAILNDEDLQLMDMAMNEGMYTMRMLENDDAMDTSSDSAVSSMGSSERQEWLETNSESSPHPEDQQPERYYGMDYPHAAKYRHYPYGYPAPGGPAAAPPPGGAPVTANNSDDSAGGLDRRIPPVAQKKYQLFGKRLPMDPSVGAASYNGQNRTVVPGIPHNHGLPSANADQSIVSSSLATTPGVTVTPSQVKYPDYSLFAASQSHQQAQSQQAQVTPYGVIEGATIAPPILESLESKYSCSVEFARHQNGPRSGAASATANLDHVQHNHTYQLTPDSLGGSPRPSARDKARKKLHEEHLSRDEKRARALKIPMNNDEIINLPMDEFNERLSKYDLTEPQLALIRDIRRRGKNKVAAQNCRKRKLDQILVLADEVTNMQSEKDQLLADQQSMIAERQRLKDKFAQLYRHVFQTLRDPDGNPYSPYEYSLQQAADGNILLVPRNATNGMELDPSKGAKSKRRDDGKK